MAKKSAPTSSKPDPAPPPALEEKPQTAFLLRPRVLLTLVLCVAATFAVPYAARYLPDVRGRAEYRLRATDIRFNDPPHWVPANFLEQVIERSGLPGEISLLDDKLAKQVAEAFQLHSWVKGVERVELSFPAQIQVKVEFRQPVAVVEAPQGLYPIDVSGTLLPRDDFSQAEMKQYPVIRNIASRPQAGPGTEWGDATVAATARLAEVVGPYWKKFGLAAIDAPPAAGSQTSIDDLVYTLATDGGSRIVWGRAPGSNRPGELTSEQKIGKLQDYLDRFGGFDQPHGPYEIQINHWQEIVRRPLSVRNSQSMRDARRRR